jgi:auxin efflux carrier family protein
MTLFPTGGYTLIAKDFEGPDKGDEEVRDALRERHKNLFIRLKRTFASFMLTPQRSREAKDVEKSAADVQVEEPPVANTKTAQVSEVGEVRPRHQLKHVAVEPSSDLQHIHGIRNMIYERQEANEDAPSSPNSTYGADALSPTDTVISPTEKYFDKDCLDKLTEESKISPDQAAVCSYSTTFTSKMLKIMRTFRTPPTISIFSALIISLIRPLKGLFVPLDNSPIPNAPDGYPPLYFVYDTVNFLGAGSVPLSLVCLGVALAKMKVPKGLTKLPLGAIGALAVGKLFILPILGVVIVGAFVKVGFIHEEDKLLQFVAM